MKRFVSQLHNYLRRSLWVFLAASFLLLGACTTTDPITGQQVWNMYSVSQEIQMGQAALQQNNEMMRQANVPINRDVRRLAQISVIVERLAAVSDLPQLPYSVTLYHTNIVNAAAAPGGAMMVFEGLWNPEEGMVDPNDENELAVVMAHEIAHVNARHVTERLTRLQTATAVARIGAAIAVQQDQQALAQLIQTVSVAGLGLWIPSYTRQNEREADRIGLFYMAKAGYDPRSAPRLWKRVAERDEGRAKTSIFQTHPADRERYEELKKLLPYAMDEYARATGGYPRDYSPPPGHEPLPAGFNWRHYEPDS